MDNENPPPEIDAFINDVMRQAQRERQAQGKLVYEPTDWHVLVNVDPGLVRVRRDSDGDILLSVLNQFNPNRSCIVAIDSEIMLPKLQEFLSQLTPPTRRDDTLHD